MHNVKYCLSGEFSGSGENFPWDFKFKENIPLGTVFYVVHYLIYTKFSQVSFSGNMFEQGLHKANGFGSVFLFS